MMPSDKSTPNSGDYRTLVVDMDAEVDPTRDAQLPEPLAAAMPHLDFSDLEADKERQQQAIAGSSGEARLVAYFDGRDPWADDLVEIFLSETRGAEVNDDLFRRYLNQGHPKLVVLLTHAVAAYPTDRDLLYDLAYVVRSSPQRSQMIFRYREACSREADPDRFRSLVMDFFELVIGDDRNAISAERSIYSDDPRKLAIFDQIAGRYEP